LLFWNLKTDKVKQINLPYPVSTPVLPTASLHGRLFLAYVVEKELQQNRPNQTPHAWEWQELQLWVYEVRTGEAVIQTRHVLQGTAYRETTSAQVVVKRVIPAQAYAVAPAFITEEGVLPPQTGLAGHQLVAAGVGPHLFYWGVQEGAQLVGQRLLSEPVQRLIFTGLYDCAMTAHTLSTSLMGNTQLANATTLVLPKPAGAVVLYGDVLIVQGENGVLGALGKV
jgi:hypothetical protein